MPSPEIVIRDLYDVYCFFEDLTLPENPNEKVLVADAWDIFVKEARRRRARDNGGDDILLYGSHLEVRWVCGGPM